jgi:outer membrane protein TolC
MGANETLISVPGNTGDHGRRRRSLVRILVFAALQIAGPDARAAVPADSTGITETPLPARAASLADSAAPDTAGLVPKNAASPEPAGSGEGAYYPFIKALSRTRRAADSLLFSGHEPMLELSLPQAVETFLESNPDIKRARLEWLASRDKVTASYGAFEPAMVGSFKQESQDRPFITAPQLQNAYTGGIEGLLPTATTYNLNFSLIDLQHRFSDNANKPTTLASVTLTQPLLQGLWFGKPVLDIKANRTEREIALQKYREALSGKIFDLELAYWKLYCAQAKVFFAVKSVEVAHEIVEDSRMQVRAGTISHIEALEASAGLATRLSNFADARKELIAAVSELKVLIGGSRFLSDTVLRARTPIEVSASDTAGGGMFTWNFDSIAAWQPEYLQKKAELEKERLARDYQANQCLPELNLKGMYGVLITGNQTPIVWDRFLDPGYRTNCGTYSVEVQLRVPLGLNIKERKLLDAQKRNLQSAEVNLLSTWTQIENYLAATRKRIADLVKTLRNASVVVDYRAVLLDAEIGRQRAGKSTFRKIFEIEEELTKSLQWQMENVLDFRSSRAQASRLMGTMLIEKGLESFENGDHVFRGPLAEPRR